jgi:hypothetical protein
MDHKVHSPVSPIVATGHGIDIRKRQQQQRSADHLNTIGVGRVEPHSANRSVPKYSGWWKFVFGSGIQDAQWGWEVASPHL